MSKNSIFISPMLQKIEAETAELISTHLKNLDRVSNDIRGLETSLRKAGIPFTFIYVLSSERKQERRLVGCDDSGNLLTTNHAIYSDTCLVWEKSIKDEFQLNYKIFEITNDLDQEGVIINKGLPLESFSRQLIETKANIRLKYENELPYFFSKIIEALKTNNLDSVVVEESPNIKSEEFFSAITCYYM